MKPAITVRLTADEVFEAIADKARQIAGPEAKGNSHTEILYISDAVSQPERAKLDGAAVTIERTSTSLSYLEIARRLSEAFSKSLDTLIADIEAEQKDE